MPPVPKPEILISVDVEASGPSPGTGSLIAIGACLVDDPEASFYREVQPIPDRPWDPRTERIHGLTPARLVEQGVPPARAMADFAAWLADVAGAGVPVFVGFNAPFDWMFVADYFHRFLGHNPFGYAAMDLKAVYLGRYGLTRWAQTTKRHVGKRHAVSLRHTHHALDDARMQAALARELLRPAGPTVATSAGPSTPAADASESA